MSDLAPFVASILRDDSVYELQQENLRLQRALRVQKERQMVRLTDASDPSLVFAQAHLAENGKGLNLPRLDDRLDEDTPSGGGQYLVQFKARKGVTSLQELLQVQIRVGTGLILDLLSSPAPNDSQGPHDDSPAMLDSYQYDDNLKGGALLFKGRYHNTFGLIGPCDKNDFNRTFYDGMNLPEIVQAFDEFFRTNPRATLKFFGTVFRSHPHILESYQTSNVLMSP